jgi:hypothetical protein
MGFEKVEYSFPETKDETTKEDVDINVAPTEEVEVTKPTKAKVEEGIEVEVIDDTPKPDRGRKPSTPPPDVTDDELEEYSEKVQKRIKHFSKGYHDERRAKEQVLRERKELEAYTKNLIEENNKLKSTVDTNQAALLTQAKQTAARDINIAKALYRRAFEAGDTTKVVEAQEKLTIAKLKEDKLDNFTRKPLQKKSNEVQIPQQPEAPHVDPRAQQWAQENSWFQDDLEMTGFAQGLHEKLVSSGVDPRSEDYYETIDTRMRQVFPDQFDEPETRTKRRSSNIVAPATRSTSANKVTLNRSQVALAKRLGVPLEEYAKQQAALQMRNN